MKKGLLLGAALGLLFAGTAHADRVDISKPGYVESQGLLILHYKGADGKEKTQEIESYKDLSAAQKAIFTPDKTECWIDYNGWANCEAKD